MITLALRDGALRVRSLLFTPATRPELTAKALAGPADAVVVDLEDSVAEGAKARARAAMRSTVRASGSSRLLVRINAVGHAHHEADVAAVAGLPVAVVLPRADADALAALPAGLADVVALVETAAGIRDTGLLAADARVRALMFSRVDLAADLEADPHGPLLDHAADELALRARAVRPLGLVDAPCTDLGDVERVRRETRAAMARGYLAKACVHPAQVPVVHDALAPTAAEVAEARAVVAAYDGTATTGHGAVALDGRMIDAPVVARARRLLGRLTR